MVNWLPYRYEKKKHPIVHLIRCFFILFSSIYAALRPCLAFASRRLCHSTTMGDATNAEE